MPKSLFLSSFVLTILIACSNNSKKQAETKCYINDGLAFKTIISLTTQGKQVHGTISSEEISSGSRQLSEFDGVVSSGRLKIHFKGKKPATGDASEWTDKPWRIGKDKLYIIFNAKDYEDSKREETEFIFDETQCN